VGVLKAAQTLEHVATLKLPLESFENQIDTERPDLLEAMMQFAILISMDSHQVHPLIDAIFERLPDFDMEFVKNYPLTIGYLCNIKHLEEDEGFLNELDNYPLHLRELFVNYCLEYTWPSSGPEWVGKELWSPAMQQHLEAYKLWLASGNRGSKKEPKLEVVIRWANDSDELIRGRAIEYLKELQTRALQNE
jgi:hypothetical protein